MHWPLISDYITEENDTLLPHQPLAVNSPSGKGLASWTPLPSMIKCRQAQSCAGFVWIVTASVSPDYSSYVKHRRRFLLSVHLPPRGSHILSVPPPPGFLLELSHSGLRPPPSLGPVTGLCNSGCQLQQAAFLAVLLCSLPFKWNFCMFLREETTGKKNGNIL